MGKGQEFFYKLFGKGNIDQEAVKKWNESSKTIYQVSALLFPSGNKGLLPHIIALTLLIYGTVDSVEYILNFGTNFKQSHVESFLKTKPVKAFILWFHTEVKIDEHTSQRVVALILSSMTAYRMKQILCAEKYFQARVGEYVLQGRLFGSFNMACQHCLSGLP